MKGSVKIYTHDGKSGDQFPIKLVITHQQRIKRTTIARSHPDDWDPIQQLPIRTHPHFENLYSQISHIRIQLNHPEFLQMEDLDQAMAWVKDRIRSPQPTRKPRGDFYSFADDQIQMMKKLGRDGNAVAYQFTVDQLKKFAPSLALDQITSHFLEGFKQYKKAQGLKNTSIRTYLYEIRAIYNKAARLGLVQDSRPFSGIFQDLPVRKRRYKNQYLDADGIRILKGINGVSQPQQLAVDLALLQFYLGGADLVDVYYLKKSQLVDDRVYLVRKKLGEKGYQFDLKLVDPARAIIEKYQDPDGIWLFPWSKDRTRYQTFRSNHNAKLKRIQVNAGIPIRPSGGTLTTKVIRHTFATLGKFHHLDADLIRELMGHERDEIDTIYKDKFPQDVRDAALEQIVNVC
jgi:site-specific recombinase XerD